MIAQHNMLFFEIGRILKSFREDELYKDLGEGGYDTWGTFLANGELGIGKSTAYAYIGLYEFYIQEQGFGYEEIGDIPYDKLRMILPVARNITDKEQVDELVSKARHLSRTDLAIETGLANEDGIFKTKSVTVAYCPDCRKYRLPEDLELCECQL